MKKTFLMKTKLRALMAGALLLCVLAALLAVGCRRGNEEPGTEAETDIGKLVETAEILPGRHRRETDYMADFLTQYLTVSLPKEGLAFSMHMADSIFEEAKLRECAAALGSDLTALRRAAGEAPEEVTVYLVLDTGSSFPVNVGTSVFCTLNDFESGAYREALSGAAYGLTAAWQAAGLTAYALEAPADIDLAEYYADGTRALTASCSALHLSPLTADGETVRAARETARSLAQFVLAEEGLGAFRNAVDPLEKLPAWQESAGIRFTPPEGREETALLKVLPCSEGLAEIRSGVLSVIVLEDGCISDADGLYAWLLDYYAGMELVTEQIREEAPSAAAIVEERLREPFKIYLTDPNSVSYTYPGLNEMSLSNTANVWHEMVHLLLEVYASNEKLAWECEAIAEHFSLAANTAYAPTQYICRGLDAYLEFFAEVSGKEAGEDDMIFHSEVWRLYGEFADPDLSDRDDLAAVIRAYGISSLLLDEKIERTQRRMKYDMSVAEKRGWTPGKKSYDGNALSYPEATVLFDYLAEVYGTDAAVEAYMRGFSLEKAFGISYSELLEEAKESFLEQYAMP